MGHRERPVQFVNVGFGQIVKFHQQLGEIFGTIRFHFQPDRIALARTSQLLLDRSQKILRFFIVDIEIAVARDAKRVDCVENQTGKQFGDVLFDQRSEINIIPRFVIALAARH